MAGKIKDLTGQRFGRLVVVSFAYSQKGHAYWNCFCDCGNTHVVVSGALQRGDCQSCGCMIKGRPKSFSTNEKKINGFSMSRFNMYKQGAIARNIEFNISIEYVTSLFTGKCNYTNRKIDMPCRKTIKPCTGSLDRIDSSKGYIEGNVQWVHKDINRMKNNYSHEEFLAMCKEVYLHSIKEKKNEIYHQVYDLVPD